MTGHDPEGAPGSEPMVRPFPRPGQRVHNAYRELHKAVNGTVEEKEAVGPANQLPRPWDPATCADPGLRSQLWAWFDEVVLWLNHEHTWDLLGTIPTCWPQHPHLIREIAVLADQRRRAALALNSDPLEDWHRYALPAFTERMRERLKNHCEEGHQPWPARSRHSRATSLAQRREREDTFVSDLAALKRDRHGLDSSAPTRSDLRVIDGKPVDIRTGEIQHNSPT